MPRAKTYNTHEMLTRSMEVFWDRGYEATSIEDLTTATGVSRSSIYQAYGSKRGLFDAVIDRYLEGTDAMLSPLVEGTSGLDDIIAFFENWRAITRSEVDGSLGCLVVNTLAERGRVDFEVLTAGNSYRERLREAFLRPLRVAADRGEIVPGSDGRLARILSILVPGLFISSRGQGQGHIEQLLNDTVAEVESWRAPHEHRMHGL